jgi:hypothetical protein
MAYSECSKSKWLKRAAVAKGGGRSAPCYNLAGVTHRRTRDQFMCTLMPFCAAKSADICELAAGETPYILANVLLLDNPAAGF